MNHKIPCEIIKDLLPLYVDGLTSEATDREIREHLEECGECREMYGRMKCGVESPAPSGQTGTGEIDYLKKVRRRNLRNVLLGAAAVFVLMASAAFVKLFLIGHPTDSYIVTYTNVNGNQLNVGGVFYGSADVFSRYKLVPDGEGTQKLVIYTCLPSFWNRNGNFNLEFGLPGEGERMDINGITVNSDGTVTGRMANELYRARNPYIGNMSANGRIAGALGIAKELGDFHNELQTSSQPYGWTLDFEDGVLNSAAFEEKMKAYSCVLIALIDNLGQVSWNYTVELEDGPVQRSGSMTEQECTEYAGGPVKAFAESPERIQELCDRLGIRE